MKTFKASFAFLIALFFSNFAFAETLLNGCKIEEKHSLRGEVVAYKVTSKDSSGKSRTVLWRKDAENGLHDNDGSISNNIVTTSSAVSACASRTLRLPSKEDFEALKNCFGKKNTLLSDAALEKLYSRFPDMRGKWFWSNTVYLEDTGFAYGFAAYSDPQRSLFSDNVDVKFRMDGLNHVYCVY